MVNKTLRRPLSLSARLTAFISLATVAAFAIFTWIMIHSVENHFAEQDVDDLRQLSIGLRTILSQENESQSTRLQQLISARENHRTSYIYLGNKQNQPLYQSPDGPDLRQVLNSVTFNAAGDIGDVLVWQDPQVANMPHDAMQRASYRIVALAIDTRVDGKPTRYNLLLALSIDFHLHYIQALKDKLIMTATAISAAIVLMILFIVYQGHAPIRQVSRKIQGITSENLSSRLSPQQVPIELAQLVISFNQMIERIEDVFTRQSHFSADIAHEIRTPITNLVTQTEIALSQPRSAKEYEDVLYSNLEEFSRMAKMVSDMLFLSQADNNLLIPERVTLYLSEEVGKVFDFFEAWAEERQVSLQCFGQNVAISGDALMLRRAISNLLSNAIRYTPAGMAVSVRITDLSDHIQLIVENPGSAIDSAHLHRLFDRFYRVDPSRQRKGEGSGIGLAIVKSIIQAHRGTIAVTSDAQVTRFIIALPKA